jgi:hypothetical protein
MKVLSPASLRALLPLLLLGGLGGFWWWAERSSEARARPGSPASELIPKLIEEDFTTAPLGGLPTRWEAPRGTFAVVAQGDRKVLEFGIEPMVEGRVLLPGLLTGGGMVRARMQGAAGKRTFPRFGVGLGETAVYKLLALPGEKQLRLVLGESVEVNGKPIENDTELASVPWTWQPDIWCWLEFSVTPAEEGSLWEGRCWPEGSPRPTTAMLSYRSPTPPKLVRATLHVAPYALKPIYIDRVETARDR